VLKHEGRGAATGNREAGAISRLNRAIAASSAACCSGRLVGTSVENTVSLDAAGGLDDELGRFRKPNIIARG
jgi:hypothetical protein